MVSLPHLPGFLSLSPLGLKSHIANMSLLNWCSRRAGGLALIGTVSLSYWVISREAEATRNGYKYLASDSLSSSSATTTVTQGAGRWTVLFAYYCLLIHVLVFIFPLRSMYSTWDITCSLEKVARSKSLQNFKLSHRRRGSSTSLSSSETLTSSRDGSAPSSSTTSEAGDLETELYTDGDADGHQVVHAIVVPNYKEEVDTLRETLDVLASHPQARDSYDVSSPSPFYRQPGFQMFKPVTCLKLPTYAGHADLSRYGAARAQCRT